MVLDHCQTAQLFTAQLEIAFISSSFCCRDCADGCMRPILWERDLPTSSWMLWALGSCSTRSWRVLCNAVSASWWKEMNSLDGAGFVVGAGLVVMGAQAVCGSLVGGSCRWDRDGYSGCGLVSWGWLVWEAGASSGGMIWMWWGSCGRGGEGL